MSTKIRKSLFILGALLVVTVAILMLVSTVLWGNPLELLPQRPTPTPVLTAEHAIAIEIETNYNWIDILAIAKFDGDKYSGSYAIVLFDPNDVPPQNIVEETMLVLLRRLQALRPEQDVLLVVTTTTKMVEDAERYVAAFEIACDPRAIYKTTQDVNANCTVTPVQGKYITESYVLWPGRLK